MCFLKIQKLNLNKQICVLKFVGHEIPEIRIRALENIETKVNRAIKKNEQITFNATLLLKWLIRWFRQAPLCQEKRVLELIYNILNVKKKIILIPIRLIPNNEYFF